MAKEAPGCPTCGARVFNRRYPKCEFCGAKLPDSIVFTVEERRALQKADEDAERVRADVRAKERLVNGGPDSFDTGGGADGIDAGGGGD